MSANRNLFAILARNFPRDPGAPLLESADGSIRSYAEILDLSARIGRALRAAGATPGERVMVQVEKTPEALALYLAALRIGAIYLPLNTGYRRDEVEYFLADAAPKVVVVTPGSPLADESLMKDHGARMLTLDAEGRGSLMDAASRQPAELEDFVCDDDTIAAILYTSGTTGKPKGAMLSHGNLSSNAAALHEIWRFDPRDRLLHALPIFHTHGLFVALNTTLMNGTSMIFLPRFDAAEIVRLLPRATVMMGVPTFYTRLLATPEFTRDCCRQIRLFISGSAPLTVETFNAFKERTGHTILERYGMTEANMVSSNPYLRDRVAGSVGFPLPGVSLRIADDQGRALKPGEVGGIEVKGPNIFHGYWRNPEKTKSEFRADGFFITGDVGRIDERGYVHIVGRSKDLIISGGFNVYPKEVETVIDALPGVAESAVIGVPHADFGEAVVAVVVARPQAALAERQIAEATREHLATYKAPKAVFLVKELPRNTMGKVEKAKLRETYKATFAQAAAVR
ncbi:malonyl-CoA synthase [Hypericibacter terrae]|uniref:3-methylmercaptopropionyl-CoA ligase n=1 Tax=Hypericibacter terrae TaxID=2602015 RepID=A0A5J6MX89_9PROT|nr:AMP-binding protein [Hypericibacter terrae]QEX19386.1 malonyl-CoA synthase [Hypericibacter terrae]